jgi:hypothetical protein
MILDGNGFDWTGVIFHPARPGEAEPGRTATTTWP